MNLTLATSPLPPPSLTPRGDEQMNSSWTAVTLARLDGVDDVHRRIGNALSLRRMKKQKAEELVEETWSAIKNSVSEAKLTEEVIRPMFMPPPETADEGQQKEGDSKALRAKKPRAQRRRRRRRKLQHKRILYSPLYPLKMLHSSPKNANRRNRQVEDSRKRRRQNVSDSGSDSKRPRQSRPKDEDPREENLATVHHPYKFWRPQDNFFSVQIPTVRQNTNTKQRRDEKRRQRGWQRDQNKSENPRELEKFWSEHLKDLSRNRSKKGRRRKHHGAPHRRNEIAQEQLIHHHSVGDGNFGKGHMNIVIRVLPVMSPSPLLPQQSTSKRMWSMEPDATPFSDLLGTAGHESGSPSWKRYDRGRGRIRRQQFIRGTGPGSIRVIDVGGGGSNSNSNFGGVGAALFFALPILLLLGVGAGFLATNYSFGNNGVFTNNFINISLADINNTFVPTNTATATNTNTDTDTTTVTGTNTNTVTGRKKRSARNGEEASWTGFLHELKTNALSILGTSESMIFWAFRSSLATISRHQVAERVTAIGRMVYCARDKTAEGGCVDKGVCLHFAEEHAVYGGNVILRGVEIYVVAIQLHRDLVETAALWDLAISNKCHSEFHCSDMKVASCFDENSYSD